MSPEQRRLHTRRKRLIESLSLAVVAVAFSVNWDEVREEGLLGFFGRLKRGGHFIRSFSESLVEARGFANLRMEFPENPRHKERYFRRVMVGTPRYRTEPDVVKNEEDRKDLKILRDGEMKAVEGDTPFPLIWAQKLYTDDPRIPSFVGLVGANERRIDPETYGQL